ncbi:MAG: CopG family ribbon-helix-helix protein [Kiritimatiellia bacterium]|jgi:CopG family transcriptional regulator/antitoxin EndoAI
MGTSTVNIAFPTDFLKEIDDMAAQESRSRSEFLREAARAYIERKRRWSSIFALGQSVAKANMLVAEDVEREIAAYRQSKTPRQ